MYSQRVYFWFFNHTRGSTSGTGSKQILRLGTKPRRLLPWQAYSRLYFEKKDLKSILDKRWKTYTAKTPEKNRKARVTFISEELNVMLSGESEKVQAEVAAFIEKHKAGGTVDIENGLIKADEDNADDAGAADEMLQNMQT